MAGIWFADFPSMGVDLWPYAMQIEARDVKLFRSLYDSDKVYVTDRFFAVTGPVYAQVFNREMPKDYAEWHSQLHVIYLAAPLETLMYRLKAKGTGYESVHQSLAKVVEAYSRILVQGLYPVTIIPTLHGADDTEIQVAACIKRLVCH